MDEDDIEVIRAAAEQRRRFVESKRGEGHDAAVAGVLYQIDEAEVTLLDPEMRRDYDRRLNLFGKRRRRRQVDPTARRPQVTSRSGNTVGEESGIVRTFVGVMAVLLFGVGLMAWFSFHLPWQDPPMVAHDESPPPAGADAVQAPFPLPREKAAENESASEVQEGILSAEEEQPGTSRNGAHRLFNGMDFQGWNFRQGPGESRPLADCWQVDSARRTLICLGTSRNWLETVNDFDHFTLELEWRFVPDSGRSRAGSGVLVRSVGPVDNHDLPRSIEVDIADARSGDLSAIRTPLTHGGIRHSGDGVHSFGGFENAEKPRGQWNVLRIACQDDEIAVHLNGQLVNQARGAHGRAGKIALLSQGTAVEFRNIQLTPNSISGDGDGMSTGNRIGNARRPQDRRNPELVRLRELDPPVNGAHAFVSRDGLTILWDDGRQIWMAKRKNVQSPFQGKQVVTSGRHPCLSGDGLQLFMLRNRADSGPEETLCVATRPHADAAFGRPQEISELRGQPKPKSLYLTADGLKLYFNRVGPGGKGTTQFVVCTRSTPTGRWSTPRSINIDRRGFVGRLTWICVVDDGHRMICSLEPPEAGEGNLFVWTRRHDGAYANPRRIELPGIAPLVGRAPRYVSATKELYFTHVVQRGQFELWVLRNFDLATLK